MTYGRKPYSTKFTARGVAKRYLLSGIPPTLWTRAQAKAKREGVSMRALLLGLVEEWLKEPHSSSPGGPGDTQAPDSPAETIVVPGGA